LHPIGRPDRGTNRHPDASRAIAASPCGTCLEDKPVTEIERGGFAQLALRSLKRGGAKDVNAVAPFTTQPSSTA
jgi:hypothetical protein